MKKIILSVLFILSLSFSFSQSFMHGAGVGIFVLNSPGSTTTGAFALGYSPRFNFVETDALSISVGVPINAGISGSYYAEYNSYYGGYENNTLKAFINVPAMLNLNVGAGSTHENESRFGFFAGGGYGLHYGDMGKTVVDSYGYETYVKNYAASFGPAGNAGVRIAVGSHQKNIEIRLSYMKISGDTKLDVYGANVYFNF
ncbi:MAG: hypothetical protein JST09_08860 [Bacteroidetes bacterium]|nr:hypothetical protein [Bacteroidota bacterium]